MACLVSLTPVPWSIRFTLSGVLLNHQPSQPGFQGSVHWIHRNPGRKLTTSLTLSGWDNDITFLYVIKKIATSMKVESMTIKNPLFWLTLSQSTIVSKQCPAKAKGRITDYIHWAAIPFFWKETQAIKDTLLRLCIRYTSSWHQPQHGSSLKKKKK